jgi:hypothetical protein
MLDLRHILRSLSEGLAASSKGAREKFTGAEHLSDRRDRGRDPQVDGRRGFR